MGTDTLAIEAFALALWIRDGHDSAEFGPWAAIYRGFAASLMYGIEWAGYMIVPKNIPEETLMIDLEN